MSKSYGLILLFIVAISTQINSMESQESQTAQCTQEQNKQESPDQINLQDLPPELQLHILQYIAQAKSTSNPKESFKNLAPVSQVNQNFYNLVHDEIFLKTIVKAYFSNKTKEEIDNAFFYAILNRELSFVKAMLSLGLDPNTKLNANTALIAASKNGYTNIVNALLSANANLDIQDKYGYTALIWASIKGNADIVKALLAANADINIQDNYGNTALILAFSEGHINIVNILLSANANPDIQDKCGYTALIMASIKGHADIVKSLLTANANPNIQDKDGSTALDWAYKQDHTDIVNAIEYYKKA